MIVCFVALTWKLVYTFIFTSNHFRTHPTRKEREREKKETSSLDPPITPIHLIHPHRSKHQWVAPCPLARSRHEPTHLVHRRDRTTNPPTDRPTSSTSEIAPRTHEPINPPSEWPAPRSTHHLQIDPPRPSVSHTYELISLCPFRLVILIFVSCVVYIFWFSVIIFVWILRKCEKHDKNRFSRAFLATQPNTRKYFPKYFLECNQTLENIFIFRKYFTPENILHSENILHPTKRNLNYKYWKILLHWGLNLQNLRDVHFRGIKLQIMRNIHSGGTKLWILKKIPTGEKKNKIK